MDLADRGCPRSFQLCRIWCVSINFLVFCPGDLLSDGVKWWVRSGAFALDPGPLANFIEAAKDKSIQGVAFSFIFSSFLLHISSLFGGNSADRGWALANAVELQEMSDATAAAGETAGAGTDDAMNSHFISFV